MTRILVVDDSPTIRRVVTHILEVSGFDTVEAVDGQDAIDVLKSGDAKIDLVLLDFVMPRMNGFQFCKAIAKEPDFSALPVILMSAKSDRIRAQFVEQTGSSDAIGKPFDADALLLVVENAIRKRKNDRPTTPRLGEQNGVSANDDDDVIVLDSIPPNELVDDGADPTALRSASPGIVLAAELAGLVLPALQKIGADFSPEDLTKDLAEALTPDAMRKLAKVATDLSTPDPVLLSGDLSVMPIGAILQLLQSENQTGRLVAASGKGEITATFRGGLIDLVQSKGAGDEFRLGRYFLEAGLVSREEIDAIARGESLPKKLLNTEVTQPETSEEELRKEDEAARASDKDKEDEPPSKPIDLDSAHDLDATPGPSSSILMKAAPKEDSSTFDIADDDKPENEKTKIAAVHDLIGDESDNETRIAASAFKREIPMPRDSSSPNIVGADDVDDAEDADEADVSDAEVLSSRELMSEPNPRSPSSRPSAGSVDGPKSATETKAAAPIATKSKLDEGKPRALLGDALVESGRITHDQLRNALVRQSSELIYEVLRWQKGRFELVRAPAPPLAEKTKLGLPVAQVVMEGFRRVDEWRALEQSLGSFESVLVRDDVAVSQMKDDAFTRSERAILDVVDGERTIREIIANTALSSFDASRILVQLLEARLLRRRADDTASAS